MANKKTAEENATEQTTKRRGRPKKTDQNVEKNEAEVVVEKKTKKGGVGSNGNLIPVTQRTKEEARQISTNGGVASGIARRKKKELREFTRDFLMQDAAPALKGNMKTLGVDAEQMTNLAAMVVRAFSKAVNQGDLNAIRNLIEWAGMAPLQLERENEAMAKISQVIQMTQGGDKEDEAEDDVVFFIPDNGRNVIREDDLVTISDEA